MAPPIVMLVINGVGTQMFFTPINTYLVDAMQKRSAEAIAVNNFFRYLFAAAASSFVLPMINGIGLGWTMTIGALCCWLALALILVTMRWGEKWREDAAIHLNEVMPAEDGAKGAPAAATEVEVEADAIEEKKDESREEREWEWEEDKLEERRDQSGISEERASRRASAGSDSEERAHGEPSHLPTAIKRTRTRGNTLSGQAGGGLARERSRRGSAASLPTVGELLQRTVSISGTSVHGG